MVTQKDISHGHSGANDVLCYRKDNIAYLNITNQCTLHCSFCPKLNKNWVVHGHHLKLSRLATTSRVLLALGDPRRYKEVVFSGLGEPTLHLSVLIEVAKVIHGRTRVRLITDGLGNLVQGMDITPLLAGKIDAVSISLNAQQESVYNQLCQPPQTGTYPALLDFIKAAKENVGDVSLTAIDELKDVDISACQRIADNYGVNFRRRRLGECV
jgi:TatD DNase family protein